MAFSYDELYSIDLDWFAVDSCGQIAHFASGGCAPVPVSVKKGPVQVLGDYFRHLASPRCQAIQSDGWSAYADIDGTSMRDVERFLEDYFQFASRGLFSFTATVEPGTPLLYYRVAYPSHPLQSADLPDQIRDALCQVVLPIVSFADRQEILPVDLGTYYQ